MVLIKNRGKCEHEWKERHKYIFDCLICGAIKSTKDHPKTFETHSTGSQTYEKIASKIGKLVDEKNAAYGDAFNKSADFLEILFPDGVSVDKYSDMLAIIRVFDKLMRIATHKDALGENPWNDITGYGVLKSKE